MLPVIQFFTTGASPPQTRPCVPPPGCWRAVCESRHAAPASRNPRCPRASGRRPHCHQVVTGPAVSLSHRWSFQEVGTCLRPEGAPGSCLCWLVRKAFTSRQLQIHSISFSNLVFAVVSISRLQIQTRATGKTHALQWVPTPLSRATYHHHCLPLNPRHAPHTRSSPWNSSLITRKQGG